MDSKICKLLLNKLSIVSIYHGVDTDRGVNADFHGYNFYQCTMVHPDQYGSSLVPSGRATFLVHHGAFGPVREPPLVPSGRATL